MKKITLILLLSIYTLSTFGIGIRQFYCCGQLRSTHISFTPDTQQKCSLGDEKDNCCKTHYKVFKIKDSHVAASDIYEPGKLFSSLYLLEQRTEMTVPANALKNSAGQPNAPPFPLNTPLYILHCVYRI